MFCEYRNQQQLLEGKLWACGFWLVTFWKKIPWRMFSLEFFNIFQNRFFQKTAEGFPLEHLNIWLNIFARYFGCSCPADLMCTPPLSAGGWGVKLPIKFSKRNGLTGPQILQAGRGCYWEREGDLFQGGIQFWHEK